MGLTLEEKLVVIALQLTRLTGTSPYFWVQQSDSWTMDWDLNGRRTRVALYEDFRLEFQEWQPEPRKRKPHHGRYLPLGTVRHPAVEALFLAIWAWEQRVSELCIRGLEDLRLRRL